MNKYKLLNLFITTVMVVSYSGLIIRLILTEELKQILLALIVPGAGVIICTCLRLLFNSKRPYEEDGASNLLDKKTTGKSFPSRHVFCAFIIAMTYLRYVPLGSIPLFVLGVGLCFLRVKTRVHYPKDVIAGAALGVIIGSFLFFL